MQVILCSGVMRSGSTWAFNAARILNETIAKKLNESYQSFFSEGEPLDDALKYLQAHSRSIRLVIKAHTPGDHTMELLKQGKLKNICTFRDPRDCLASRQNFKDEPFERSLNFIKACYSYIPRYRDCPHNLFIRYEQMLEDPKLELSRIARHLNADLSDEALQQLHEKLTPEAHQTIIDQLPDRAENEVYYYKTDRVDMKTELHPKHLQGGVVGRWRDDLTPEQQVIANKEFAPIIEGLQYPKD